MQIRILTIFLSLAAEAILAVVFFALIPHDVLPADIRWLDFAVMTTINVVYVLNIFFPFVRTDDKSHKEVGGLGLRWAATGWYSALAFFFMLGNIIYAWHETRAMGFGLQATIQAALLLSFLAGIVASMAAIDKTQEVYRREQAAKKGKADIKSAVAAVLAACGDQPDIPAEFTDRIRRIAADTRFISPSASAESRMADKKIINDCDNLEASLSACEMDSEEVAALITRLERDLQARKNN